MTRVSVDDQIAEVTPQSGEKLADVLKAISAKLPPNRIVKEVLLDGQSVTKSQRGETIDSLLAEIKELQIRTADREIWAANGLDIALSSLERISRSLIRVAEFCQEPQTPHTEKYLRSCIDGLENFFETIAMSRGAMNLDFSKINVDGITLAQIESEFLSSLETMISQRSQGNFLAIAETVEYELIPNLSSWTRGLTKLRLSHNRNA